MYNIPWFRLEKYIPPAVASNVTHRGDGDDSNAEEDIIEDFSDGIGSSCVVILHFSPILIMKLILMCS